MFKNYKEFINENIQPFSIANLEAIEDMLVTLNDDNIDLAIQLFKSRKDIKGSKEVNDKIREIKEIISFIVLNKHFVYYLKDDYLYLREANIGKHIDMIFKLINKQCKGLDIRENELTFLPKEIGLLTNLTTLDIGINLLKELPKEIVNLKNLTFLNLGYNKFTSLPKEIFKLTKLQDLYLDGNELSSIPNDIKNLKKLKYLGLYNNQIEEDDVNKIFALLPNVINRF